MIQLFRVLWWKITRIILNVGGTRIRFKTLQKNFDFIFELSLTYKYFTTQQRKTH